MQNFIRRNEVWVFLALIVLVNAIFISGIIFGFLPKRLYGYGRFALLAGVLFTVVFYARRWDGAAGLLRPMLEWRRSPFWYLFAISWSLIVCTLVLVGKGLFFGDGPFDFTPRFSLVTRPDVVMVILISSFIGEIVWIGYAINQLSRHITYFEAALVVGFAWTAWWAPMVIYNFGVVPDLPLMALLFNQTGIALLCTLVYFHTRSGLVVLCMQVVFNSTILIMPVTPTGGGVSTYWAFAVAYLASALVLFLAFGPRPLFSGKAVENTV